MKLHGQKVDKADAFFNPDFRNGAKRSFASFISRRLGRFHDCASGFYSPFNRKNIAEVGAVTTARLTDE
jgi:hypothetical protein